MRRWARKCPRCGGRGFLAKDPERTVASAACIMTKDKRFGYCATKCKPWRPHPDKGSR